MPDHSPIAWGVAAADLPHPAGRRAKARALALRMLAALGGEGWSIEADPRGRPMARGPLRREVSISHARRLVAAAASAIGPVGIDVEYHDQSRDVNALAEAAYGQEERRTVLLGGATVFYRIWTIREAIAKATGDGMALVADRLDRVPASMARGVFTKTDETWMVAHDVIAQRFSLALAVRVDSFKDARFLEGMSLYDAMRATRASRIDV